MISRGPLFLNQLADVLGVKHVQRIVIVADVHDNARVYVKGVLQQESVPGILDALKVQACETLDVDEATHEVVWTPEG